jgi:hypothetical protein
MSSESLRQPSTPSNPSTAGLDNDAISKSAKWQLWGLAWSLVVAATFVPDPAYMITAPWFPVGLLAIFPGGEKNAIAAWMKGLPFTLLGWLLYLFLSAAMARARKERLFILIYVIFCIVLALNLVGCQITFNATQQIH